jgi:RHS repeat-associated protein
LAQLSSPNGVAFGPEGNLYIADVFNGRVRCVTPSGLIYTIAGTGQFGYNGDSILAVNAQLNFPTGVAVGTDGSVYIADYSNGLIRKVTPQGIIQTIAGAGGYGNSGDGGSAINASLRFPNDVAAASDGSIFITDLMNDRIRMIDQKGIITTFAGSFSLDKGDGGMALQANLNEPVAVTIGPDNTVYVSDHIATPSLSSNNIRPYFPLMRVRQIKYPFPSFSAASFYLPSANGSKLYIFDNQGKHLQTVDAITGMLQYGFSYDNQGLLISITNRDSLVTTIERDTVGKPLAIVSPYGQKTMLEIGSTGYLSTVCDPAYDTTRFTYTNDGLLTSLTDPKLNVHSFEYDSTGRLRIDIDPAGGFTQLERTELTNGFEVTATTAEGRRTKYHVESIPTCGTYLKNTSDNGLSTEFYYRLDGSSTIVSSDGTVTDQVNHPDPRFGMDAPLATTTTKTPGGLVSTVEQSRIISQMTGLAVTGLTSSTTVNGRTYKTIHLTDIGSSGWGLKYDFAASNGTFSSIAGEPGTATASVSSQDDGTASNIPIGFNFNFHNKNYSQVAICTNGWISFNANTTNTDNGYYGYNNPHVLSAATDIYPLVAPLYDDLVVNGEIYYRTTGTAPQRIFTVEWNNVGWNWANSGNSISFQAIFYEETGVIQFVYAPGTDGIVNGSATIGMADLDGFLSVSDLTTSAIVSQTSENDYIAVEPPSGLTFTFTPPPQVINNDDIKGIFASVSPEGRQSFSWVNEKGRVVKDSIPGIEATTYNYDPQGRLMTVSQAGRTASYTYDAKSLLATATDPIQRTSRFEYDSVGRITRQVLPDLHEILYSYDANGNLTSLIPPSKPAHNFDYTKVDLTNKYTPPILGIDTLATRYEYNKDKQILRVIRPDSGVVEMIYDTVGCSTCGSPVSRPKTILFDRGELDFKYSPFTGQIDTLISPSDTTTYSYDGPLLTSVSKGSANPQYLNYFYDNNFRVTDQELWVPNLNSDDFDRTVDYNYDQDALVTSISTYDNSWNMVAPPMNITYDPTNGLPVSTSLGNLYTGQTYNEKGELDSYEADCNGSAIFHTNYTRDSLGRITSLTETNLGSTMVKKYQYDIAGRLWQVWRNDTLISTYSYDQNGNRIAHVTQTSADSGTYDAQDRLLKYSTSQYLYTPNGELRFKIAGTDTTRYTYDYFGNLITVIMPNGDRVDYIVDGQNRRIGKKLNGVIVKRWIYSGQLSPVAELDSAGNVVSQFIGSYMIKNGNTYEMIRDHLGSIRLVVDVNTGTIAQQIEYNEFGNVTSDSNPDFQPFAYAGGLYDSQTKLTRFGARDYEAETGRWTCKDPIGFGGKSSNIYTYVGNDPINYFDKNGLTLRCVYQQSSGHFYCYDSSEPDVRLISGVGYAGSGEGKNKPEKQDCKDVGPIPTGDYTIEAEGDDYGGYSFYLTPDQNNNMHNRGGFYIHAENWDHPGESSTGCIVIPDKNVRVDLANIRNSYGGATLVVVR